MFSFEAYLKDRRRSIDKELDDRLPAGDIRPANLHEAIRYSVFSGGKRLRPVLCGAAAEAVGGDVSKILLPSLAIELLHTYSLIHDDLPSLDNDELRRGLPTCHVKYGDANALLAGDALLIMAFEWLAKTDTVASNVVNSMIIELAQATGSKGMVAGQIADMNDVGESLSDDDVLNFVHEHKTAHLFIASARIGAMGCDAKETELNQLSAYAKKFGMAFQIIDDIDDAEEDKRLSAVGVYGLEGAKEKALGLLKDALKDLEDLPGDTLPLKAIANNFINRVS